MRRDSARAGIASARSGHVSTTVTAWPLAQSRAKSCARLGTGMSSSSSFLTARRMRVPLATIMLMLSLVVALITFTLERTNVLLGAVHLLLFLAYLMLLFEK